MINSKDSGKLPEVKKALAVNNRLKIKKVTEFENKKGKPYFRATIKLYP